MNTKGILEMIAREKPTEKNPSIPDGRSGCASLVGCAVRNPLKRKDLNAKKAGMERARGEKAGIGE
jgi:hypothetical protein